MTTGQGEAGGSITVFMTFIFLLLFALTGTVLDSARFFGSGGYMKISAYGADVAVYGNYNRELFQEYGLFGYGGCNGIGEDDWTEDYRQILLKNLAERPMEEGQGVTALFSKRYASVYQLGAVSVRLEDVGFLDQEEQFLAQLGIWMKTAAVKDITQKLLGRIEGTDTCDQQRLLEGVKRTSQVEEMEQQIKENQKTDQQKGMQEGEQRGNGSGAGDDSEAEQSGESEAGKREPGGAAAARKENPLDFLRELVRDGVLTLVCDEDSLAENEIDAEESYDASESRETGETAEKKSWDQRGQASGILKGLLGQSDSLWNNEMLQDQKKKGLLLLYASRMLGSFVDQKGRAVPYGLEYMVTGQENQKDAFADVVNRLFLVRTLLNYLYVSGDPVMQEKSMVTATAITAPLGAEAFIPVIQQSILLILALEEACVDITALLEGRCVPVLKNQTNFKMNYEEMCMASKVMFQNKASSYPEAGESVLNSASGGLGYVHYLWLFLLMTSWEHLYPRCLDAIQSDLRERYNQSFELDCCICRTRVTVDYGMPLLASVFLVGNPENAIDRNRISRGMVMRRTTVSYCYH